MSRIGRWRRTWSSLFLGLSLAAGCNREPVSEKPKKAEEPQAPTNRIDIPETVRRNLGITFAKVESRAVAQTIRVPGQFELLPDARREYRTMLSGRVELRVTQFDRVEAGQVLYVLDAPAWRELQSRISETLSKETQLRARAESVGPLMAAHEHHHIELEAGVNVWAERLTQMEQSRGVVTADEFAQTRAALATKRAELAEVMEKEAALQAQAAEVAAELSAARSRLDLLYAEAASLLGVSPERVALPGAESQPPLWRATRHIEIRAAAPGVVDAIALTNGAWAGESHLVLSTMQPDRLRFRARGLQSDMARLRDGLSAKIVPPKGGTIPLQDDMPATLKIGLNADPQERTVDLIAQPSHLAAWARAGISAHMEIATAGGESELAIPLSCVIQDGLEKLIFRRDPKNPDKVIRMEADLGINDGRWVVVKSGVREGDEIVFDGVYQLMIASSGSVQKGGHFHADGTFHAGEDE